MKRVFAILFEPASYTIDRNNMVYDKLGISYCYINSSSKAKSDAISRVNALSDLSFLSLIKTLWGILSKNDVIIMNGYTSNIFLWLFFLNIFHKKTIGLDSDTPLNIPENRIKRLIKKYYLRVVFTNKRIFGLPGGTKSHKALFSYYGMSEKRIFLMPMMVNNRKFNSPGDHKRDPFVFLYVGRLAKEKNLNIMLEAFAKAFENKKDIKLRIVGTGELGHDLRTEFENISNIEFVGPKYGDSLIDEYKSASALILPSSYEPWGLVVNEAMSAGLPVIVSDKVGASDDLVVGQDTGFVFVHYDEKDLIQKMKALNEDKELYSRFSMNAYTLMNNYWNYDLYEKCLINFINKA